MTDEGSGVGEVSVELVRLAQAYDIATEFWDWQGRHIPVPAATIVAVLAAMDVDASSPEAVEDALAARRQDRWVQFLPECVVVTSGSSSPVVMHAAHGAAVEVWVEPEDGGARIDLPRPAAGAPVEVDGALVAELRVEIPPDLPLGYHTLHARQRAGDTVVESTAPLIVTPAWLGVPERLGHRRAWGLATQLYSVRSRRSWGVGDLGDLAELAAWSAAEHQAGFILVNPLHAAQPTAPMQPSPYLPTTRRFVNPLYLRVEEVAGYADLPDLQQTEIREMGQLVRDRLNGADEIDRDTSWTAKRSALELIRAGSDAAPDPRTAARQSAFAAYRRREGPALDDFATWCALAEVHGVDWTAWPLPLQDHRSAEVAAFREARAGAVDFHRWLQWCCDEQLAAAQSAAIGAGMPLGVVHDLAVGVSPYGSDTWRLPDVYAAGITVGAPPDAFNQAGQDWVQPPWRPDRLAQLAYAPFRDMVAGVLRHAGGVRVDHIIGLFRLWWIPAGAASTAGTYVRYDHEALVGILALEAHRAGALVVGEDLGTVEPWVRDYLRERGILGTSILWFENDYAGDGGPLRPESWREYCLASVTTHDLPPTAGYLAGEHVRLREALGLLTRPLAEELAVDEAERRAWVAELHRRHAFGGGDTGGLTGDASVEATIRALYRYLTWTPARLITVALTDAVGDRRTQNQPGTIDEYPNWRVPLTGPDGSPIGLEDVRRSARATALAAVVQDVGAQ